MKLKDYKDHLSKKETDDFIIKEMVKNTFNYFKDNKIDLKQYPNLNEMIQRWQIIVQNQEKRKFEKGEKEIYLDLLKNQRRFLFYLNNRHKEIDEKIIRTFVSKIDLEEQRVL